MACTGPGGPCYGENGEPGFCTRSISSSQVQKKSYWIDPPTTTTTTTHLNPPQPSAHAADPPTPPMQDKTCTSTSEHVHQDFHFPSWDQLPLNLQNPTTSTDFNATIPIPMSTLHAGVFVAAGTAAGDATVTAWDDGELDFPMDMDLDFDFDFDMRGNYTRWVE